LTYVPNNSKKARERIMNKRDKLGLAGIAFIFAALFGLMGNMRNFMEREVKSQHSAVSKPITMMRYNPDVSPASARGACYIKFEGGKRPCASNEKI
jgi:hypothetical protein